MAHNQDRLQNSDSSVVYGHGHIIYDRKVAGDVGDTPLRQAIKQPTMSLNGPPQKHISVLKGMCTFAYVLCDCFHQFLDLRKFKLLGMPKMLIKTQRPLVRLTREWSDTISEKKSTHFTVILLPRVYLA